jgi:hypothetical protein
MMEYDSDNKDFLLGFIGALAVNGLMVLVNVITSSAIPSVLVMVAVLLDFVAVVFCFVNGRAMVAWGIIAALVAIPLLLVGACFVMLTGIR